MNPHNGSWESTIKTYRVDQSKIFLDFRVLFKFPKWKERGGRRKMGRGRKRRRRRRGK